MQEEVQVGISMNGSPHGSGLQAAKAVVQVIRIEGNQDRKTGLKKPIDALPQKEYNTVDK